MRTWVYVDGFNLYYGAVKGTALKWLNPVKLAQQILPSTHVVERVKYFTAHASGAGDPGVPRRQHAYLSALRTLPEVEIFFGRFLAKTIWRPITNFPVAGAQIHSPVTASLPQGDHLVDGGSLKSPATLVVRSYPPRGAPRVTPTPHPVANALIAEVHAMEEKGSDVNLAAHLLNDAWKNSFDVAAVFSNDTDLIEPIRMVAKERNKPVFVVCPGRWGMARGLQTVATYSRHIKRPMLAASQFPNSIPGTAIMKPAGW
ncbi:MAG: NYN domain-containing protein [Xanthobacteraceae bacterium]|jgi:hypothetical protein